MSGLTSSETRNRFRRSAARHLRLNHAVTEIVARDQLSLDLLNAIERFRQSQRTRRPTLQPRQMRGIVRSACLPARRNFVDAVGEQEATVEHRHLASAIGTNNR